MPLMPKSDPIYEDGMPSPQRWYALAVVSLGTCMAVLDSTIANVALPSFVQAFSIDAASSIWIVNAFQLTVVAVLLPFSSLSSRISLRRVYWYGLIVFTIGSFFCAMSHNFPELVAARILQGLGAGGILSIGPAMSRTIFPQRMLGTAVGISAIVVATSSALGPTLGGLLLSLAPWPWIFAINVPLGLLNIVFAGRVLPNTARRDTKFDVPGMLTSGAGLALLVFGFDAFSRHIAVHVSPFVIALGAAIFAYFVYRQTTIPNPLVEPRLFRNQRFSLAALTSFISFTAQGLALVSLPFFIRAGLSTTPLHIGALLSTWPLSIAVIGPIAGRLADRYPAPLLSTIGLALLAIGLAWQGNLSEMHASPLDFVLRSIVCGVGFGFFQPPNNRELLGSAPRELAGNASGILATVRVLGQTTGAAVAAVILAAQGADHGAHVSLFVAAGISAFAAVVSSTRLLNGPLQVSEAP
jgi:DHA2 family multidrug resistance protein-like MFS transporter